MTKYRIVKNDWYSVAVESYDSYLNRWEYRNLFLTVRGARRFIKKEKKEASGDKKVIWSE